MKKEDNNKRPNPKDYNDFLEWWDAVEKWEQEPKRMKKAKTFN